MGKREGLERAAPHAHKQTRRVDAVAVAGHVGRRGRAALCRRGSGGTAISEPQIERSSMCRKASRIG